MINGYLKQFLDTGWYSEATLYFKGFIYWCEAQYDAKTGKNKFIVDKWEAENENDICYHSLLEKDGSLIWQRVFEEENEDLDLIKKHFLQAPIFDGKGFWSVEKQIAWLDEGSPIKKNS